MDLGNWMEEARGIAATCWCDEETRGIVLNVPLAEAVARRIAAWIDTAMQNQRNTDFYRDLLYQCAANLGPLATLAYTADDGSVQDSPLALKIPALVAELASRVRTVGEGS